MRSRAPLRLSLLASIPMLAIQHRYPLSDHALNEARVRSLSAILLHEHYTG
jgi:hypothetical protein